MHSTGGGGSVLQANASLALSAAGNRNSTCQVASQGSGGLPGCLREVREPVHANEGGLTARHGPVGRFWVGRPAGHRRRSPTRTGG